MFTLAFAPAAFGQSDQSGDNISPDKPDKTSPAAVDVANLVLAWDMAAYGRDNKSPLSLSAAAEIIASIGVKDQALEKTAEELEKAAEGDEAKADGAETPPPAVAEGEEDAQTLFAEAAAMAKEQKN
jgi:hypothetical protein